MAPRRRFAAGLVAAVTGTGPAGTGPGGAGPAGAAKSITLLTGDQVSLITPPNGKPSALVKAGSGREHIVFSHQVVDKHLHVYPADAAGLLASGRLDKRLFDVTLLAEYGYDDAGTTSIPLIVTGARSGPAALSATGVRTTRTLASIRGSAVAADKRTVGAFWRSLVGDRAGNPGAEQRIWLDGKAELADAESNTQIGVPAAWNAGLKGNGVTVAVLDTGVDGAHPDLAGRLVETRDFIDSPYGVTDTVGHGTHVASIVAGTGSRDGAYVGVAPLDERDPGVRCQVTEADPAGRGLSATGRAVVDLSRGVAMFDGVSTPGRLAELDEGISDDELGLAARNHGMPLEALRYDITPPGLHYLLIHYDIPVLDAATWRLRIGGLVGAPLHLDLDALRAMPSSTVRVTLECAGNGRARLRPRPISQPWLVEAVGTAEWTGVPLRDVLANAEVDPAAVEVVFTGADHGVERGVEQDYQRSLAVDDALGEDVLLAYAMNGAPLPPQHGHPVRLVVPGWYGMAHVKWLVGVDLVAEPFGGFQQAVAYRMRQGPDEPGEPVTRIAPRALLVPPGFPDFMSRTRIVRPGPVRLEGRAWSGRAPVVRVEVSPDAGRTWSEARLEPDGGHRWAWRRFTQEWTATPGRHVLTARATGADGEAQPVGQAWNRGGFANNATHEIPVVCLP
ncbi:MAG TPA: molybdopterin-dependent oxidoreductase [Pilimelia sp.]|nr:molybdopterin-dependent oxidoreductase [Pilimelia sp.]